jgi:formylglycine-generating enzyme required for sulfatase activity
MSAASPVGCARCGTILGENFRFCPECGLPVSGGSVLSTEIAELRRRVESASAAARDAGWRRYLLPVAATAMFVFVVVLGLVLFNNSLLNRLFPEPDGGRAGAVLPAAPRWEPLWVDVPAGEFPYDDPSQRRVAEVTYPFKISKYEVSNGLWFEFLKSERHRLAGLWQEAFPRNVEGWTQDAHGEVRLSPEWRRNYPVTGVSPVAIAEFCAWLTRRLNNRRAEIRIPTRLEWEYAARGKDGRAYSWGDDDVFIQVPHAGSRRPRAGVDSAPRQVEDTQLALEDSSAFGVVGMGTNVSEWNLLLNMDVRSPDAPDEPDREDFSAFPPAAGLREALEQKQMDVIWRGASFLTDLENPGLVPRAWSKTSAEVRTAKVDVGIRLVKVEVSK